MREPELPRNEKERLRTLQELNILDSPEEERFDRLTRIARRLFGVEMALVSLVDEERQWFKSRQGLDACQTDRSISFCGHAILKDDILEVPNALEDERFHDNPLVTGPPHIRFYAGAPLRVSNGMRVGTFCIIDSAPRSLSDEERQTLRDFADTVEHELQRFYHRVMASELEKSQRRLTGVLEGTRIGTWEWNVQTGETVFNERWAEIVGYRLEELEPVNIDTWLNLAHPDDLEISGDLLALHFRGELPEYDCHCRMRHKDGHWVWVHDRGRVMSWTETGEPLMMYGTHADVTREMEAKQEMELQIRALTTLNEIASNPTFSVSEQISNALELGTRFLEMDIGIVSEIYENIYRVDWFHAPEEAGLRVQQTFDLGQTYCVLALENGDVLAIDEMQQSIYRGHPCYDAFALESYIGTAIEVAGKLYGTLNFSSPAARAKPFREADRMFVRLLARWVGGAIERYESKQRLSKLATQFSGMMYQYQLWPDGSSCFPYCSPGIREIYGVCPEDVETDAGVVFEMIHPDDLEYVTETIQHSVDNMAVWRAKYRVRQPGGQVIWVEGYSTPERAVDDSIIWHGTIHDISEQKRAEEALQQSEARLRALFELSPIGIGLNDFETGDFLEVNDALLASSGYSREEFLQLSYWALTPKEYKKQEFEQLERLKANGKYGPYEKEYIRKDGERYPVVLNGTLIKDLSGRKLIWSIIEDISERKRMERLKNEFVSAVSHELRTPLTSISGALGLVASGSLGEIPPGPKNMVAIAHKNSQRLTHLINDLLDMDKLISGKMTLDFKRYNLYELVDQSIENIKGYAEQYSVNITFKAEKPELAVMLDAQRFEQVMANLLSNAIKFSHQEETVEVSIVSVGERVRVGVRDYGPGIPESFRDRMFQKFAQADASDSKRRGGTGLGLAITKELVEKMDGRVDYQSTPGEGAFFYVDFPVESAQEVASPLASGAVLVVEDDPETAGYLKSVLEQHGHAVDVAFSGEQAVDYLRQKDYDLVSIDLLLPGMHGLELIRHIKAKPELHRTAVVVLTAEVSGPDVALQECFPDVTWLAKPVNEVVCRRLAQELVGVERSRKPRILHVEDDSDLHNVLRSIIGSSASFELARSKGEALSLVEQGQYDVVIIDVSLPDGNGLDLVSVVREALPSAKISILTGTDMADQPSIKVDKVIQKSEISIQELLRLIDSAPNSEIE